MKNSFWIGVLVLTLGIGLFSLYWILIVLDVPNLPLRVYTTIIFMFGILCLFDAARAMLKKEFIAYIPKFPLAPFWWTKKKLSKKRAKFAIIFNIVVGIILLVISFNLYQQW